MGKKMETEVAAEVVNQLSMWDMVWSSDLITKAVMIGLIAASVWSWAIIFEKINTLRQVKRLSKTFEERFGPAVRLTSCTIPSAIRRIRCRLCLLRQ